MAYDDTASRRSHGGRSQRAYDDYDDRYDNGGGSDRRSRAGGSGAPYYDDNPPPLDNSSVARRHDLPAAYYNDPDPSVRSSGGRSSRRDRSRSRDGGSRRSRSRTPPSSRKSKLGLLSGSGGATTTKGDILSAVGGALIATAADKYFVEPRMNKGAGGKHRRSKSHNETWRRVADVGVGGVAGTALYRAVSRSRARKKGALADSRPGSPDSRGGGTGRGRSSSRGRGRDDSRDDDDRKRSRSKSIPWKGLLSTAAGGIAGLAAEQMKKRSDSQKDRSRSRSRGRYSDDDYSDDSRRGGGGGRRHHSADGRDDRRNRNRYSSDDDSEYDRRDSSRRQRRSRGGPRGEARNPHEARDMAMGLIGAAQGLAGKNKGQAAMQTAVGAAGLAHKYYTQHKANRPPAAGPR